MEKTNRKSNLRIIFSALALISFVLFALCDNLMVNEYTSYHTYGWRLRVLNDLFLAIPFVAILVFSIMERRMKHINGRVFVVGIFVLYFIQTLFILFSSGTADFSIFCCGFLESSSELVTALLVVRVVMLVLIPVAQRIMLKIYSAGMISFFGFSLVAILTADYFYMRHSVAEIVITLSIDIVFHIALFFFSDLLNKENESIPWRTFLGTLMYPIFGSIFDDDDYDLDDYGLDDYGLDEYDFEEFKSTDQLKTDYATEYKKILMYAMNDEDSSFLAVNSFLRNLSCEVVSDDENQYYSIGEYVKNLTLLSKKVSDINSMKPGFISEGFVDLINLLLNEKDEESFRMDVITVAKLLFNERMETWMGAVKQYTEQSCKTEKSRFE